MQLHRTLDSLPENVRGGAVSIGNFDGVHLGHASLVSRLVAQAKQVGRPAVVFTFDPHPLALLKPEIVPTPMTRIERKAQLLSDLGVDVVIAYPTDWSLLSLSPQAFFDHVLRTKLDAKAIVEGPNFHFGKGRAGDVKLLAQLCHEQAITLEVVEPVETEGEIISSSRVRELIRSGAVGRANQLLSQPFRLSGVVGRGAARGRTIGFPTANLEQVQTVLPAFGVYAGRAWVDATAYPAAVNIGPNPTFGENEAKIEVHVIDFEGDLYDRRLDVDLLDRLRDIRPFPSKDELIAQLHLDIAETREYCSCALPNPSTSH